MRRSARLGLFVACFATLHSAADSLPARAADLLIRHARIVDASGASRPGALDLRIHAGRIEAIGPQLEAGEAATVLDASGMTVLPGLIDTHVHFSSAPGAASRGDTPETTRALNRDHLRAYLACGVTTVLDPGSFTAVARDIQGWLAAGHPGPRYLTTGPLIRMPQGYGHPSYGSVATPADVEAKLDEIQAVHGVGVKLAIEIGGVASPQIESYPPEIRAAIVTGAKRRGLPLYVHAMTQEAQAQALDLGAHALMHAVMGIPLVGSYGAPADLSDAFVARLAAAGVYQLSTLSLFATWPGVYDLARLDDPRLARLVPASELASARAPDASDRFAIEILAWAAPWTFERARPWIYRTLLTPARVREAVRQGQRHLARLHHAGVPIVAATDAPSPWPAAMFNFHGPQLAQEIELLAEAGLSPVDAIAAATRTPARMLGLDAEIGTIEVGKRADLVIVRGDPLADLGSLRDVVWTVRDGVAGTPAEWLARE